VSRRFTNITDDQWRIFVADVGEALELREGETVFEVQCGSGAFLLPLYEAGCAVGGSDADPALIALARHDMPTGEWAVGDAPDVVRSQAGQEPAAQTKWDVVMARGVLEAATTLADATVLLGQMVANARRAVAILDVPSGLPFDERWFLRTLSALGATSMRLPDLRVEEYASSPHFNVIARLS